MPIYDFLWQKCEKDCLERNPNEIDQGWTSLFNPGPGLIQGGIRFLIFLPSIIKRLIGQLVINNGIIPDRRRAFLLLKIEMTQNHSTFWAKKKSRFH
jgi:hypothetical protein